MTYFIHEQVVLSRPPEGPVAAHLASFASFVCEQGYRAFSLRRHVRIAAGFSRWLGQSGIQVQSICSAHVVEYSRDRARHLRPGRGDTAALQHLILRGEGVIPKEKVESARLTAVERCALMERYELPIRLRNAVERMLLDIQRLTRDIKAIDVEIKQQLSEDPAGIRLLSIPGIGPLTASALVADVGDASTYKSSRDFAASLGLVPRQYSTGGKTSLLGISKRGDKYLRCLLVQGAHALMIRIDKRDDALGAWVRNLLARKPPNKVACALANKMARVVWAVLARGGSYNVKQMA